jgi:hypothetical protein
LSDSAVLSGGTNPTGTITFTLTGPGGFSYTQTDTVNGNGTYTASDMLPTAGTVVGTYTWSAHYSGDNGNTSASDQGGTAEQTVVSTAHPSIVTTASGAVTLGTTGATLSDSAVLSGGFFETGTITFTLTGPGGFSYTQTDTVSGNGTYTASDMLTAGAAAGTYTWSATYSGNGNNLTANDQGGTAEQTVVSAGQGASTATIGFWHNKNGQTLLKTYGSALGNWLASTYPNLWGNLNGATGTQVASYYSLLFNSHHGSANNHAALEALCLSLNVWVTATGLGWNTNPGGPQSFGFHQGTGGSGLGSASYNVGSNGASFGVPNDSSLTVNQILSYFNSHATVVTPGSFTVLRTWSFYSGNGTLLNGADSVMDMINNSHDI